MSEISKISISKPKLCQVLIQRCGFDTSNTSFKKITNTNAEKLLFQAISMMASEFTTEDQTRYLLYTLALDLLNELLKDKSHFNLITELKTLPERVNGYQLNE